jgi:GntR family transcriptional regulator
VYIHRVTVRRHGGGSITIIVSLTSPDPIYRQIEDQVRAALFSGELEPGAELPSIRRLAQELRVSVITTKRAYEELEREGLIRTLPARGSFVADSGTEELRARRLEALRCRLAPLVDEARSIGLAPADLAALVEALYKEEKHG